MADIHSVPLVVDLDGTIIRTDLMWESLALILRRNPLAIFQIFFWWSRGRARLKKELAARVLVDAAALPYIEPFLAWLRKEKASGRKVILASASDRQMVQPVVDHLGFFDEVLASDGRINLRRDNKRKALVEKFGERGFDYAGNSRDDLTVWRSARQAIVVNASAEVLRAATATTELGPTFCERYSGTAVARRFVRGLFWDSGYLVAMCAGVLLALAFPKFNLAGFAWAAPAILLAAAHGKSRADSFRVGYVGGLAFWLVSLYWLLLMPAPIYSVVLGWGALSAYIAVYFGAWTALVNPPRTGPAADSWAGRTSWAMGGAAAWVAMEMIRARLLSGFPWSFLGVSQYQITPLIQISAIAGVYGVSFLVAWFSLALYSAGRMIVQNPSKRQVWQVEIVLPMLAIVGCYVAGFFATMHSPPADRTLRVTAIQPSVPQTLIWSSPDDARRFEELLSESQQALTNRPDLLVWPESAVPPIDEPTFQAITQFVRSNHLWLILNGEDVEFRPTATNYFNAAFLVGPDGHWWPAYHKRELVIFGEYVPLATWLPFLKWLTPIQGGWTAGDKPGTFALDVSPWPADTIEITRQPEASHRTAIRCAPLICFEDTFAPAARDSVQDEVDFLINLTNDGWFGESAEQRQHMANAVFRTVENGLPLLRCANNGVSCLINAHGRATDVFHDAHGSEYGRGALTVDIPIEADTQRPGRTFYNQHGDAFGWACVAITALALARRMRRPRA